MKHILTLLLGAMTAIPSAAQQLPPATMPTFPDASTIVEDQPEGTLYKNLSRHATSWYTEDNVQASIDEVEGYIADFVRQDDGTVWLKNPFTFFPTDSWMRLDPAQGDTLVAQLPQAMFRSSQGQVFYAMRMEYAMRDDKGGFFLPESDEGYDVKFTLQGNVLKMVTDGNDNAYGEPADILGLATKTGGWSCYGEAALTISPLEWTTTSLPEGVETKDYTLNYTNLYGQPATEIVQMGFSGKEVYMSDPVSHNSAVWLHGTLSGQTLTFLTQYLGPDEARGLHLFLAPATDDYADETGFGLANEMFMTYDAQTGAYTAPDDLYWLVNVGTERVFYDDVFFSPSLTPEPEATGSAQPENPSELTSEPYTPSEGGSVQFSLASTDVEGDPLAKSKLCYRIHVDKAGDIHTFAADTYESLSEDMTDVPYTYDDQYDFFVSGEMHKCYIYRPFKRLGVQAVYHGESTLVSDIVWTDGTVTTGIKPNVNRNARPGTKATTWHRIDGSVARQPLRPGVYIGRNADGTVTKVVRK